MARECQRVISHFGHRHPLKLISYDPETLNLITSPCSACKLQPSPSGMLYSCTICRDYFLHQSCFEMPRKLTHPFHKQHALTLMAKPAYGNKRFKCDACGERGNGFSYHCKNCSFDLHTLCAMLPLSVTHDSHVKHNLELSSESPYLDNKFSCDICMSIGSCQWLYRCKSCGFDAHLKCATGDALSVLAPSQSKELPKVAPPEAAAPSEATAPPEAMAKCSRLAPSAPRLPPMQEPNNVRATPPPFEVKRKKDEMALEAIHQMIIINSKELAQALLSGTVSGGNNRGLHLLIEWIAALYNNTTGIGGSGGDATDSVQIDDGTAGAGQDSLRAIMEGGGGGGGGGQDDSQALTDGGGRSSFPEKITHPFDKTHALTLLSKPAYDEGRFRCDACQERGKGFSYHCQPCSIDLHISCAMLPSSLAHDSHVHSLRLVFISPYPNNKFSCDICLKPGSRQWLYICKSCGFNAHLKCAAGDIFPPVQTMSQSLKPTKPQEAATWGPPPPMMNSTGFSAAGVPIQNMIINNGANTTMTQGLMRLISNGVNIVGGGEEDYQELLFGDGNGIGFLGGLLGG